MSWKPLLHFSYENHAALDETGNGFNGRVELPTADRWSDVPVDGISTAIRFDHPESKIVVATRPQFSGWRGFRVRVYFSIDDVPGRLNLVEGDASFALFVEPDGVLRGTINDGSSEWWGVSSQPGRIKPGRWYFAELLYDAGKLLALSLDGQLLGIRITAGLPVRPVATAGIRVGYWPGGDARYTFKGLMGPVWIDTLDEREPTVGIINKLLCNGSDGTSRLESWQAILEKELSSSEKASVKAFGATLNDSLKQLLSVVIGQASSPVTTLDEMTALADDLGQLAASHEAAGTNLLLDPTLNALLQKLYTVACHNNPAAPNVFVLEALKLLTTMPLSATRWKEIANQHPELCTTGIRPIDLSDPNNPVGSDSSWIDDLINRLCKQKHGKGNEGDRPPTTDKPDNNSTVHGSGCDVHVHIHCCNNEGGK
ncbi:MAG: hypothetical protein KME13_19620 [Myxacorys californica WJT36-NPBG1]|jgi:hypothetical protein|nr:hypothetical protein [Myxacorys californica WJT36-NPBG1]